MTKKFYITTAIDYIDDVVHIGHAYQKIVADVLARYHRLLGKKVFFLTGVDEHGGKAEKAAKKARIDFKKWADKISEVDKKELRLLNVSFDRFIRTTDKDHEKRVVEFWHRVEKNGDVYLGKYVGIYCEGCEGFITKKDLIKGKCPFHPAQEPVKLTEKNYFFRWSKYESFLKKHIKSHPEFLQPEARRNEMLSFLDRGLEDIPISRPSIKWGIKVPGDPKHTIYVWFDALINYLSGVPKGFWPADVHMLGKDNVRWHALFWPAMLKSAGYELPKTVYGHGFISLEGKKISKSLGNIIRPSELATKVGGADPIRYYLLKIKSLGADGDLSLNKLTEVYNADLANGLGNLVARVAKLCQKSGFDFKKGEKNQFYPQVKKAFDSYRLDEALRFIWQKRIAGCDRIIDKEKPWLLKGKKLEAVLQKLVNEIRQIAFNIKPFLPETADQNLQRREMGRRNSKKTF